MSEGGIPIRAEDLPTEIPVLDDSLVYTVELQKVAISLKRDKNDNRYCAVQVVVAEGDYEGAVLQRNYLPLPPPEGLDPDAGARERFQYGRRAAQFGRFVKSFKIKGIIPPVWDPTDEVQRATFHEFMEQFYGMRGKVSIENSEYQGRVRSAINDFLY